MSAIYSKIVPPSSTIDFSAQAKKSSSTTSSTTATTSLSESSLPLDKMFSSTFSEELTKQLSHTLTSEELKLPARWTRASMQLVTLENTRSKNRQRWQLMDYKIKSYHLTTFDTLERMHSLRSGLFRLWDGEVGACLRALYPSLPLNLRQHLWTYSLVRVSHTPEGNFLREFTLDFQPDLRGQAFLTMIACLSWAQKDPTWTPVYFVKIEAAYKRWIDGFAGDNKTVRKKKLPFFEGLRGMCRHANEWWWIRTATEMFYVWARVMKKTMPLRTPPTTPIIAPKPFFKLETPLWCSTTVTAPPSLILETASMAPTMMTPPTSIAAGRDLVSPLKLTDPVCGVNDEDNIGVELLPGPPSSPVCPDFGAELGMIHGLRGGELAGISAILWEEEVRRLEEDEEEEGEEDQYDVEKSDEPSKAKGGAHVYMEENEPKVPAVKLVLPPPPPPPTAITSSFNPLAAFFVPSLSISTFTSSTPASSPPITPKINSAEPPPLEPLPEPLPEVLPEPATTPTPSTTPKSSWDNDSDSDSDEDVPRPYQLTGSTTKPKLTLKAYIAIPDHIFARYKSLRRNLALTFTPSPTTPPSATSPSSPIPFSSFNNSYHTSPSPPTYSSHTHPIGIIVPTERTEAGRRLLSCIENLRQRGISSASNSTTSTNMSRLPSNSSSSMFPTPMTYSSVVRKAVALPSLDLKTGNRPDLSVHPTLLPTPPATPPPKTDAKRLTENEEKFNEAVVKLEEEDGGESVAVERLDLVGGRGRSVNIPTDKDIEMYGLPMKRSWSCDGGERLRWEDDSDYDSDEEDA